MREMAFMVVSALGQGDKFTGQQHYFAGAQKQPFLTPEREQELGTRARKGDKKARDAAFARVGVLWS
jgi:hypothetical protein